MAGIAKKTVMRPPREVGEVREVYQSRVLGNLTCRRIQLDELSGFNFIRIHRTLRLTPAMAAGVTNRLWGVSELVGLWELAERELAA